MCRPAAASNRAPSSMKKREPHSAFPRCFMKSLVRLVKLPRAGEHASVLVRIGISEHDFLAAVPCIKTLAVSGIRPDTAANLRAVAQIFNRFKKRNRHESCGLHSRQFRQP